MDDEQPTPEHEALLRETADALRQDDQVPADVLDAARRAIEWRAFDAEWAEFDPERQLAGVRGPGEPQLLRLSSRDRRARVELTVTAEGGGREVLGRVVPAQPARMDIGAGDELQQVAVDDEGRFRATVPPSGSLVVICRPADGPHFGRRWEG